MHENARNARKPENYQKVYDNLYPNDHYAYDKPKFHVGDKVRLSVVKNPFDKGYFRNWTQEMFEIESIKHTTPITYIVKDLSGSIIKGSFYTEQLQKTSQTMFYIEKVIGKPRIRNGIKEIRVKWMGYGNKFNQWIPQSDLVISSNFSSI